MNLQESQSTLSRYQQNIDRAFRFIDLHFHEQISLEQVSQAAYFSPYHFHRIFKAITGETLHDYISRKRCEKAAILLQRGQLQISQIATIVGYNSHSGFSRAFSRHFGISPANLQKATAGNYSKISKTKSKNGQILTEFETYICRMENLLNYLNEQAEITITESGDLKAAAITHIGEDGIGEKFYQLIKWGTPKGLTDGDDFKMGVIYHDSFKVTSPDQVRMEALLITEKEFEEKDEIHRVELVKGRCIKASLSIVPEEIGKAWTALFIWMNEHDYQKADRQPFEVYHNDFNTHPEKKCIMEMYIPIL